MWGLIVCKHRLDLISTDTILTRNPCKFNNMCGQPYNAIQALSQLSYSPKIAYMQQLDATIACDITWHLYKRTRVFGTSPLTSVGLDD